MDQPHATEIVRVAAPYVCTNYECHQLSLVFMAIHHDRVSARSEVLRVTSVPQGRAKPMDGLPQDIEADRLEAWSCFHADNFKAAIIMGRSAIQRATRSLDANGPNLNADLQFLRDEGVITEHVRSLGDAVRIAGNEAAHPSELSQIDVDEAQDSLEFMDAFLEHAIALPARQKAKENARSSATDLSAESTDERA